MKMLKTEWLMLLKDKKMLIAMIGILFIPILYAGIILSSYWDPYGNTSNLPVAIVNLDQPASFDNKTLTLGDELVQNLKENGDLKWFFLQAEQARSGFNKGDYYMLITIPEDFSRNASTVLHEEPQKLVLHYEVNPGRNFFSETIGKQATDNMNRQISESMTKAYTKAIFEQINGFGDGLHAAAQGATTLYEGTVQLSEGNDKLTEHLIRLADASLTFKDGTYQLQSGVSQFAAGLEELQEGTKMLHAGLQQYNLGVHQVEVRTSHLSDTEQGMPKLFAGQQSLNTALSNLSVGGNELHIGLQQFAETVPNHENIEQLAQGLAELQTAIQELNQSLATSAETDTPLSIQLAKINQAAQTLHPKAIATIQGYQTMDQVLSDRLLPGSARLQEGLSEALVGSQQLMDAVRNLNSQVPELTSALGTLAQKSNELENGASTLAEGSNIIVNQLPVLVAGTSELVSGVEQIHTGLTQLSNGSGELGDGISALQEGSQQLANELQEGSHAVQTMHPSELTHEMIASPVTVIEEKTSEVPNYGHALAPNFISLALYIGALAFNLIVPLNKPAIVPTSGRAWWFSKFSLGFVQSTIAALILSLLMIFGMGLQVDHIGQFIVIAILASMTYMFLIMTLGIALGNPGRFLALLFLVLQLSASGGMFPIELQNRFFQAIHPYMPMTYIIYGFREAMTSSLGNSILLSSISILLGIIVALNLILLWYMYRRKQHVQSPVLENL